MRSALIGRSHFRVLALAAMALLVAGPLAGCRTRCCRGTSVAKACTPAPEPVAAVSTDPCSDEPGPPPNTRPPTANAGEAWCQVWIPPVKKTCTRLVCVEQSCIQKRWIPPVYATRPIIECVSEAKFGRRVQPAQFKVRRRELQLRGETTEWARIACDDGCGCQECWTKKTCPPVSETVCERCCLEPSKMCLDFTPAQYRCVHEKYELRPGFCQEVCIPARYESKTEEICVTPGRWEWRRNTECEVPEPVAVLGLPALQVELIDQLPSGKEEGIFTVGQKVRYSLRITHDDGSMNMDDMRVVFELPAELRFVSGSGKGITVSGDDRSARTSAFSLAIGQERTLHILAEVVSVSPTNLIQLVASVRGNGDIELARETESTTVKAAAQPVRASRE